MAEAKTKSRTFRRIKTKIPGNRSVMHYAKRRPSKAQCAACGAFLKGTPRETPKKIAKLSKTQRRPERAYGGVLCSRCARSKIKSYARELK